MAKRMMYFAKPDRPRRPAATCTGWEDTFPGTLIVRERRCYASRGDATRVHQVVRAYVERMRTGRDLLWRWEARFGTVAGPNKRGFPRGMESGIGYRTIDEAERAADEAIGRYLGR